jgi:hypothetical protein
MMRFDGVIDSRGHELVGLDSCGEFLSFEHFVDAEICDLFEMEEFEVYIKIFVHLMTSI